MVKRVLVFTLFLGSSLFALPAKDVVPLPNRDYVPALHKALQGAKKSIHITMFTMRYYPQYPNDANSIIISDLIEAKRRGVDVKLILDASNWNLNNTRQNKMVADSLQRAGVDVYFDPLNVTTHNKMILIDGEITILGSHNWSYYALERNNEVSVLIRSKEVTRAFERVFQEILKHSSKTLPPSLLQ
jgi:phosphatidylserine/phosphatidylglycerophosphate/cardiolipin synthase-like enzyme